MMGLDAPRLRWFWVVAAGSAATLSIFQACDSSVDPAGGPDDLTEGSWLYVGYTRACPGVTHEQYRGFWFDPTDFLESKGGRP